MHPRAKRIEWSAAKVNITFDGNSMVDAVHSNLCTQLQALRPLNGNFTINNFALSGQSFSAMTSSSADVDGSWVSGKTNVLLIWEITNTVFNQGKTGLTACSELSAYIAARKAVHPWKVVVLTAIPRGSLFGTTWDAVTGEAQLQSANAYLKNNYRGMGIDRLVDMRRTGGPFDFTDASNANNFPAALWTDRTHPNSAGHAYTARYISDELVSLRSK